MYMSYLLQPKATTSFNCHFSCLRWGYPLLFIYLFFFLEMQRCVICTSYEGMRLFPYFC